MNPKALLQDIVVQISRDGQEGSGTGFYITKDLVVTCYHVLVTQGGTGSLQDRYWVRHDGWEDWEQAEPVAAYCHPPPRDTVVLRCSRSTSGTSGVRLADWDRVTDFRFASRGYDANKKKWGLGASTIEGEVEDITTLNGRPRLRLKTGRGTVASGRSGSPVWSERQRAIVGIIDWVGQEMEPGGGDEVLAIPISEVRHLVGDGPSRAEIKATIEHNIEELYVEPVDETEATPSGHAVTNKQDQTIAEATKKAQVRREDVRVGGMAENPEQYMLLELDGLLENGPTHVHNPQIVEIGTGAGLNEARTYRLFRRLLRDGKVEGRLITIDEHPGFAGAWIEDVPL